MVSKIDKVYLNKFFVLINKMFMYFQKKIILIINNEEKIKIFTESI